MLFFDFAEFYRTICEFDRLLGLQLTVHEPGHYSLSADRQRAAFKHALAHAMVVYSQR
ncbi:MAG: hypothetical protein R3F53_03475 [Gammaproteobacteria bacterium]